MKTIREQFEEETGYNCADRAGYYNSVYAEWLEKRIDKILSPPSDLKELKDITDEELTECVNILLKSESDEKIHYSVMDYWKRLVFLNLTEGGYPTTIQPYWQWILKVYQYLQHRGYRLPKYY